MKPALVKLVLCPRPSQGRVMLIVCVAGIMAALCPLTCQAQSPQITSVSQMSAQENQTIMIMGSGFGTSQPYTGNSAYIALWDATRSWQAGFMGDKSGPSYCGVLDGNYDAVTLIVNSWEDSMITLGGFSGNWGGDGGNWRLSIGDVEYICVWNPQSGKGPATFSVTIGQQATVLHNFAHGMDGTSPSAGLIFDAAGNLYGTTTQGGDFGAGTVFEMTPKQGGGWTERVLHNFGSGMDGQKPYGSLIWDAAGNLYGTTEVGGVYSSGTVFELTPGEDGRWTEKALHNFGLYQADGTSPNAGLVRDAAGNLYGTTVMGGDYDAGTVFDLTTNGSGGWTEQTLHNFGNGMDGQKPYGSLIWDAAGNLYGTTTAGGARSSGTVFEMTPRQGGGWTEKILHNFGLYRTDGTEPLASLMFDTAGNLYGTTQHGGSEGFGTVFEMTPNGSGGWTEKLLHNFGIIDTDGQNPYAGLISDAAGDLYGTTQHGGREGLGTVFEMTPNGSGGWTERPLHDFGIIDTDGQNPYAGLISDGAGNLYGTTLSGGTHGGGTVFEVTP